jgi:hypothetical protein
MSDRLTDLQRQRALMQEQMAKLEQEIATAGKSPQAESASSTTAAPAPTPNPTPAAADLDAGDIIAKYGIEAVDPVQSVRRGCFIAFGLALTLLAIVVYGFYLFSRSRH